jgi:hypothetical protein
MSENKCPWCDTDPNEAAKRHEGPHATWCVHYRKPTREPDWLLDGIAYTESEQKILEQRQTKVPADRIQTPKK